MTQEQNTDWVEVLPAEEEKRITDRFKGTNNALDHFLLARVKYIAVCRLNGMHDRDIAREIAVNYNDGGLHVKQIRESLDIK